MPVENIVAKYQRRRSAVQELLADQERLRQAIWAGLYGIVQAHAPAASITKQLLEARRILRRGNDQHVLNAGQHQGTEGIVTHWLVVHRQQLLGYRQRPRIETSARSAGHITALSLLTAC